MNAAVYTPKHAIITIKAFSQEEHLVLIVRDNGNGFPEEAIEKVLINFIASNIQQPVELV
ncbi:MAG: ATP-binding protein [Bacteroidetes bacterium]|nr:ATP-binding protein [Bacteroidota bacterium]